ncbi:hypothetical protein QBC38DRAFT_486593 [Podospora fimiseda]|uniref:Uncharacterized protein n=1 Tax=Podospora fimiseda TaxID=252190 RepID=A0AAN7BIL0_9PEZI|nr:hypothetical protein QBC38DRAFT_486593 [Podospora fimiseda]
MSRGEVDLLVAIDFGMTCTGVAWTTRNMDSHKLIQTWPGKHGFHRKVPSTILYDKEKKTVKSWGFATNDNLDTVDWFKRHLDEKSLSNMLAKNNNRKEGPVKVQYETVDEVRKIYRDYMKNLYEHIKAQLTRNEPWTDKTVDFVFSLPATFRSLEISTALMKQLKEAGFGSGGRRKGMHRVSWGLSEPQAAAVFTAKEVSVTLKKRDIILVCDAGGGTTDLALLEQHGENGFCDLREIAPVQGRDIGSTNIDLAFAALVKKRLAKAAGKLEFDKNAVTIMMLSDEFQGWKRAFGNVKEEQFGTVRVSVPILKGGSSNAEAGITDNKMNFTHKEFQSLFDPEVDSIIKAIQAQINKAAATQPAKRPNYIVLSGGLGSSAYVQQKVAAAFPNPRVIVADNDDPQLSVVKGLILDRKQRDRQGVSALSVRKARASYGVVTSERYDKTNPDHKLLPRSISEMDNEEIVTGLIVWVIKKGQDIDATDDPEKKHKFYYSFKGTDSPGKSKRELVICHLDGDKLPVRKGDVDIFPLCTVESDLSKVPKNYIETRTVRMGGNGDDGSDSRWRLGGLLRGRTKPPRTEYREIPYDVKFVVGAIDAKFELWVGNEEFAGKNSFKVEWIPEGLKSSGK